MLKKVLAFPLVRMVGEIVLFAAAATAYGLSVRGHHVANAASVWITLALLYGAVLLVEWFTVRRGPAEFGFAPRRAGVDFLLGLAIGAVLFSAVIAELFLAGDYRAGSVHFSWELAMLASLLLPAAAIEELLLRGVVFRLVSEWAGTWIALAVSAVLFGLLHAFNPGATWFSTLAIALEAGVLLAAAYVVTGNLWLPIGLHFAWNFCEGPIYGTAVSGGAVAQPLITAQVSGAQILNGGNFGPEAGLPALLTCLVVAAAMLVYAKRKGLLVAPSWLHRRVATNGASA